jgi:pimeloyl-ACP methyl ester carboxylesterase
MAPQIKRDPFDIFVAQLLVTGIAQDIRDVRKHKPPTLIVWGKNDYIFPADGAYPYKRDLPQVEFHLINTGHFALEDRFDEMVPLIRDFLERKVKS